MVGLRCVVWRISNVGWGISVLWGEGVVGVVYAFLRAHARNQHLGILEVNSAAALLCFSTIGVAFANRYPCQL